MDLWSDPWSDQIPGSGFFDEKWMEEESQDGERKEA